MDALHMIDHGRGPRTCNIGPAEIGRRRRSGILGIGAAAVLGAGLVATGAPDAWRLVVAMPLMVGLLGLLQARNRFCVAFALAGVENFGALGSRRRVADRGPRSEDARHALAMTAQAGIAALAIAAAFVLLPI
jgi:hypothetical protein